MKLPSPLKIVLGSTSPRRKELLGQLGISFELRTKDTDESYPESLHSDEVALFVAHKKAAALRDSLSENELLICADTIVVIEQAILGKPANREDAIAMLHRLAGKKHEVITGVVLISQEKKIAFSVKTAVFFKPISLAEITMYVDTYAPFDKAGGYGIQEWIGAAGIERIEGSYNNVVGLPTAELFEQLKQF